MLEFFLTNILAPTFAAGFTWILARRKFKQEVKANELENVERAVGIWRNISEGLEDKLNSALKEIEHQNVLIKEMSAEIEQLRYKLNNR